MDGLSLDRPSVAQTDYARHISQNFSSKNLTNEDDWSGVNDPIERRKRQNRLRQRAWREKQRVACNPNTMTTNVDYTWEGYGMLVATDQNDLLASRFNSFTSTSPVSRLQDILTDNHLPPTIRYRRRPKGHKLIPPLLPYSTYDASSRPTPRIVFPLSSDHCLITLVQYNVIRAILLNMAALSILDCLPHECIRSFGITFPCSPPEIIPLDLQPTPLQRSTAHPFWIKALPFPEMRDNLILLAGQYDSDDLCYDLGLGLYEGFDDVNRRGFLVWEKPWNGKDWEISEGFVTKWGFLLKGCPRVIESTNHWRELRGEDRLVVDI